MSATHAHPVTTNLVHPLLFGGVVSYGVLVWNSYNEGEHLFLCIVNRGSNVVSVHRTFTLSINGH